VALISAGWTARAEGPPEIEITQLHIFVNNVGDRVQVTEYYLLSNSGDQVFEGDEDRATGATVTLAFSLPPEAEGLTFDGPGLGERFVALDGGFADTTPIPPGTATVDVLFEYELAFREGVVIERTFGAPVSSIVLVSADPALAIEGVGIHPMGTIDTELGPAQSYEAGPLALGETLTLTVAASPLQQADAPPTAVPGRDASREIVIGLVTLAAALPAAYLLWRSSVPSQPPPGPVRAAVDGIAALDAEFEAGSIKETAYRHRREALKRQAQRLLE
jgi:hypothetical protein